MEKNNTNLDKIMEYYSKEKFQDSIKNAAREIENILNNFLEIELREPNLKNIVLKKIENRIKSRDSLKEKIERKDYCNKWELFSKSESETQKIICENLPDLIGFRINCYFKETEKILFSHLKEYLKDKNIELEDEKDENHKQNNGFPIEKIACKYVNKRKQTFCFEVQVKSLLHDTWGEVEHKLIFKGKEFDSRKSLKKDIILEIYNILAGVDKQLESLYKYSHEKENDAKKDLFYILIKDNSLLKEEINILSLHYENFFCILKEFDSKYEVLDEFLGKKLLKENFMRKNLPPISINNTCIIDNIKKKCDLYKLKNIYVIANILFTFDSEDNFFHYLFYYFYKPIELSQKDDEEFNQEDDAFSEINSSELLTNKNIKNDENDSITKSFFEKFEFLLKK